MLTSTQLRYHACVKSYRNDRGQHANVANGNLPHLVMRRILNKAEALLKRLKLTHRSVLESVVVTVVITTLPSKYSYHVFKVRQYQKY